MRAKYLGNYEIDYRDNIDYSEDEMECVLINIKDDTDIYPLHQFIKSEEQFDGIMGETNTSAIGVKLSSCGDGAKLWRIW